jgi:hypothetical protein
MIRNKAAGTKGHFALRSLRQAHRSWCVVGTFRGYATGVVHCLDDGTEWEQVGRIEEYLYRERPAYRIIWGRERHWLDVEGTSGVAEVRKCAGRRWAGSGAY